LVHILGSADVARGDRKLRCTNLSALDRSFIKASNKDRLHGDLKKRVQRNHKALGVDALNGAIEACPGITTWASRIATQDGRMEFGLPKPGLKAQMPECNNKRQLYSAPFALHAGKLIDACRCLSAIERMGRFDGDRDQLQ
jgi:hypothetical protein